MTVLFSEEARAQLREIASYIARNNKERARSFARELKEKAVAIGKNPLAYPVDPRLAHAEIRRCVHRNYLIFYQIDGGSVRIVSVFHGARDYVTVFEAKNRPS